MSKTMKATNQYLEFDRAFQFFNDKLFSMALPETIITIKREKRTYGYFIGASYINKNTSRPIDEICLNPDFFPLHDRKILSTLVHEMTHSWQYHQGKPTKGWHNKEWSDKMQSIGLMPSSTGLPGGASIGRSITHYIIKGGKFDILTRELLREKKIIEIYSTMTRCSKTETTENRSPGQPLILKDVSNVDEQTRVMIDDQFFTVLEVCEKSNRVQVRPLSGDFQVLTGKDIYIFNTHEEKARKNKSKYTCCGCLLNVWGKPDLKIKCGDCDIFLIEQ